MSPTPRRVVAAMMIAYLVGLAAIVLWPTSEVPTSSVRWVHARLMAVGVPELVSTSAVEFVSNIVLFVPLSLLGSLLWPRWHWVAWPLAALAGSIAIETTQMVFLSSRSPAVRDIVANTLGALAGVLLARLVRSRTRTMVR